MRIKIETKRSEREEEERFLKYMRSVGDVARRRHEAGKITDSEMQDLLSIEHLAFHLTTPGFIHKILKGEVK